MFYVIHNRYNNKLDVKEHIIFEVSYIITVEWIRHEDF